VVAKSMRKLTEIILSFWLCCFSTVVFDYGAFYLLLPVAFLPF